MTYSPKEVMEELKQQTCSTCDGHGEVSIKSTDGQSFLQFDFADCPDCDNGFA